MKQNFFIFFYFFIFLNVVFCADERTTARLSYSETINTDSETNAVDIKRLEELQGKMRGLLLPFPENQRPIFDEIVERMESIKREIEQLRIQAGLVPKPIAGEFFLPLGVDHTEILSQRTIGRVMVFINLLNDRINDYIGGIKVLQSGLFKSSKAAVLSKEEKVKAWLSFTGTVVSKVPVVGVAATPLQHVGELVFAAHQSATEDEPGKGSYDDIAGLRTFVGVDYFSWELARLYTRRFICFIALFDDEGVQTALEHLAYNTFQNIRAHMRKKIKSRKPFSIKDCLYVVFERFIVKRSLKQIFKGFAVIGTIDGQPVRSIDVALAPLSFWSPLEKTWKDLPVTRAHDTGCMPELPACLKRFAKQHTIEEARAISYKSQTLTRRLTALEATMLLRQQKDQQKSSSLDIGGVDEAMLTAGAAMEIFDSA